MTDHSANAADVADDDAQNSGNILTDEAGTASEEGGWKCIKCGNMNYAYRDRCNMRKCREPRPHFDGGDDGANDNDNTDFQEGNDPKRSKQMREGDWICKKCGNVNFATRLRCNMRKCQAPREEWVCKVCNNINYKFRTVCNMRKCQAPRPPESYPDYISMQRGHGPRDGFAFPSQPSSIGHNQNYPQLQALLGPGFEHANRHPGHHFGRHPGENFGGHFRDQFGDHFGGHPGDHFSGHPGGHFDFAGPPPAGYGYRRDRGDHDGHGDELSNGHRRNRGVDSFPREMREGDWTCVECGNVNFANRTQCNMRKCRAEKPLS